MAELVFRVDSARGGQMPLRAHVGDAGFDLYVSQTLEVAPGEFVDVPSAVHVALPPGSWAYLVGRSSTWRHKRLHVEPGVIDNGYRGELFAGVHNPNPFPVRIERGERLAQLIPMPLSVMGAREVDERAFLAFDRAHPTDRGRNGFGSTGK